jgi:hypothetical protein
MTQKAPKMTTTATTPDTPHRPLHCRCCQTFAFRRQLMSGAEWIARFDPVTKPCKEPEFLGCSDFVAYQRDHPEIGQMLKEQKIWSMASHESGQFLVPGLGDGCPSVMFYYRTAVPWTESTPSVGWMLVAGLPSLAEILAESRDRKD